MSRKIIFRLDDICPCMNHAKFNRMRIIFEKYNVHPIIGVIPDCRDDSVNVDCDDPEFWNEIHRLVELGWSVAMHGCYHIYVTDNKGLVSHNHRSEFAGLSYEEQYCKLKQGKELLLSHGVRTDIFMAPSHTYDKNTLKALKELGFRYVTDGLTSWPYEHDGLLFVPCKDAKIRRNRKLSTVCYHTNEAKEERFLETEKLLFECREVVIDFNEAISMRPQLYCWARIEEKFTYFIKYCIKEKLYKLLRC